jgi:hypothetical protein
VLCVRACKGAHKDFALQLTMKPLRAAVSFYRLAFTLFWKPLRAFD